MATTAVPTRGTHHTATAPSYQSGVWSWLATVDHKRIGILYLYTALTFFIIGGLEAVLIRAQLQGPNRELLSAEMYNQLFTMHGTTMIFLAIMPLSAAFFNFLIPLQIGARDVAFPRLNAFSYWVYLFGGIFITLPIFFQLAPNAGWFGYAPLTTREYSPGINIDFWVIGLQILGVSSLAAAFNFITTIINLRAPGMTLMRMPMFTWMSFVVQVLIVLAFPVITIALVFLLFDRFFGTNFYTIAQGADPLLWQHLFWIFGHPEVYILILPAFGLVSEVLPASSRKPLFGYPVMVYSGILIGALGFGVWAHHMFAVGMGAIADSVFAVSTLLIGIPTGVKIFNWIGTMAQGSIRFTSAALFAIGLVALFTIGGISGVMHASPPADLQQTDTYFVVAHFHYVLFGGSIMGIFAGIYHYFPKITGRLMDEPLGKIHFWLNFIAMNLTFFPMHFAGMLGMPRRIYTYDSGQGWDTFNLISSIGAYMLVVSTAIFVYNFFRSRKNGEVAGANPWDAGTLEWSIPSPPPEYNFATLPNVTSRYPLWEGNEKDMESARVNLQEGKTAEQLHIVLPYSTIKPLIVAGAMVIMFCGLITTKALIFVGAAVLVGSLYSWLLSPLEPEHH
ncbi:MAG: cytochrome c oxidase subunit I [Gemmatimonadaceae bacterium]|nr:cytochrome c oxidase subunit I [Gemmatimonadaceae bacterium]